MFHFEIERFLTLINRNYGCSVSNDNKQACGRGSKRSFCAFVPFFQGEIMQNEIIGNF